MFCIATFIVFGILAIFSASFRPLAAKAWHCVLRRVTFRPCDISFGEEMKSKLTAKLLFTHPRLAKFIRRWIDWLSFVFVALSVWSLLYVLNAGLNLWVYDTCDPSNAESCSLSGEACGIDQASLSLRDAIEQEKIGSWALGPFTRLGETLSRIPDRLKTWNAEEYLSPTATFYHPQDKSKPYALEIVDPSCRFCKKLTKNVKDSGVMDTVNFSYLLYPIPSVGSGGYKFPHSLFLASIIEAVKRVPLKHPRSTVPTDWQVLEGVFDDSAQEPVDLQTRLNLTMDENDAKNAVKTILNRIGYDEQDFKRIFALAASKEIAASLAIQRRIVEEHIRTIKIPTLLIGGRRYDRVIDTETLKRRTLPSPTE